MKKCIFLLLAVAILPLVLGAQTLPEANLFQRATEPVSLDYRLMVPFSVDLPENQKIMGPYTTEDLPNHGLRFTNQYGKVRIATLLEPNELMLFNGGKIVAFRVGLADTTSISKVLIVPISSNGRIGELTEYDCDASDIGWNTIPLDSPYEINLGPGEKMMIGYEYEQTTTNTPLSVVKLGDLHGTYIYYNAVWMPTVLHTYGNLSVQCIVEKDYPDYFVDIDELTCDTYVCGETLPFNFKIRNIGNLAVGAGDVTVDVLVDGEKYATISNPDALTDNFSPLDGVLQLDQFALGEHMLTLALSTLNGEPIEDPEAIERKFYIFKETLPRQKHIIEQYTSTYCTHCPSGSAMIAYLCGTVRDDVIKVAVHGNMGGVDPMHILQCDTLMTLVGCNSFPMGSFDRTVGFMSGTEIINTLGYSAEYKEMMAQQLSDFLDHVTESVPTFASIQATSDCDKLSRKATITVSGNLVPGFNGLMGADAKLNVFLTEDGVVAPQLNNGTWVDDYVHQGVFRMALPSVFGVELNEEGDTYCKTFEVTIPEEWNIDNMHVVAFISRPLANGANGHTDMYINNATSAPLYAGGLQGDVNGDGEVNIADVNAVIDAILSGRFEQAADVNGDGEVNIADVNAVIDIILSSK